MIKKEMGPKASIVSTKSVPARKSLFRVIPAQIQVEAVVEERFLNHQQLEYFNTAVANNKKPKSKSKFTALGLPSLASQILERQSEKQQVVVKTGPAEEEKIVQEYREMRNKLKKLEEENKELKQQLESLVQNQSEISVIQKSLKPVALQKKEKLPPKKKEGASFSQIVDEVSCYLQSKGVNETVLKKWGMEIANLPPGTKFEDVMDASINYFLEQFPQVPEKLERRMSFIGPEKSGKSSVIMKLAYALKAQKKKVAILTLDVTDYTTLQDYEEFGNTMDIPVLPIRQNKMYDKAIKDFQDYDHILLDTYSVSYHDRSAIKRLSKRLENFGTVNMVVYPGNNADVELTLESYKDFCIDGLVFTHLDECNQPGLFYNTIHEIEKPVYYFGIGSQVPEDFEEATSERLVALLFDLDETMSEKTSSHPIQVEM